MTFGDGMANVDIGAWCASTGSTDVSRRSRRCRRGPVQKPPARQRPHVAIAEKPPAGDGWINGGFFVFEPEVLDYIDADDTPLEGEPLEHLARDEQLMAYPPRL